MALLKAGDSILLDFDGELVEKAKFPKFGKLRPGMREFLNECSKIGVKVYIWTARGNFHPDFPKDQQLFEGLIPVQRFMHDECLPFAGIYTGHKPIGEASGQFKMLLDDMAIHFNTGWQAKDFLLK